MKLTALMLGRDEDWIASFSIRAALEFCDEVFVLAHRCTDKTVEIARSFGRSVVVEEADDPEFREMTLRHTLLERARMRGMTHGVMLDFDEVITGNILPRMRSFAEELQPGHCLGLPMVSIWRDLNKYRVDSDCVFTKNAVPVLFSDHPSLDWKPRADGYELHSRAPTHTRKMFVPYTGPAQGGVFHLQWLVWSRLIAKQCHYRLRERSFYGQRDTAEAINARYADAVNEVGAKFADVPPEWWAPYKDWLGRIDTTSPRWHDAEANRLYHELGPDGVRGLDLAGWKPKELE